MAYPIRFSITFAKKENTIIKIRNRNTVINNSNKLIVIFFHIKYERWDSNPHWTDFKSVASAYWATEP